MCCGCVWVSVRLLPPFFGLADEKRILWLHRHNGALSATMCECACASVCVCVTVCVYRLGCVCVRGRVIFQVQVRS